MSFNLQIYEFVILTGPDLYAMVYSPLHPAGVESVTFSPLARHPPPLRVWVYLSISWWYIS